MFQNSLKGNYYERERESKENKDQYFVSSKNKQIIESDQCVHAHAHAHAQKNKKMIKRGP